MSEKKQVFRSVVEIEKKYFPKSFENKIRKDIEDPQAVGDLLARESLEKIKGLFA